MWNVIYRRAYNEDGSLFFPKKLSHEFLASAKRTMGSYIFSNQYLNEIIPSELQTFKKEWFKYFEALPKKLTTFIFIDPALSEADTADYTGVVVVSLDQKGDWFVRYASRHRLTPTELIKFVFVLHDKYKPDVIGIEEVAFQKALLYFLNEEMQRRQTHLPIAGIKYPPQASKQLRIQALQPRFEFGHIFFTQGLQDLEIELLQFPRGSHDDLIDALAGIELIAFPPDNRPEEMKKPHSPSHPDFEKWVIQQKMKEGSNEFDAA